MTAKPDFLERLRAVGWHRETEELKHQINAESCHWYEGKIDGVEQSAWIGTKSRMVYLHCGGDYEFDEFIELVRNGWPKVKVPAAERSLFGDDDT